MSRKSTRRRGECWGRCRDRHVFRMASATALFGPHKQRTRPDAEGLQAVVLFHGRWKADETRLAAAVRFELKQTFAIKSLVSAVSPKRTSGASRKTRDGSTTEESETIAVSPMAMHSDVFSIRQIGKSRRIKSVKIVGSTVLISSLQ